MLQHSGQTTYRKRKHLLKQRRKAQQTHHVLPTQVSSYPRSRRRPQANQRYTSPVRPVAQPSRSPAPVGKTLSKHRPIRRRLQQPSPSQPRPKKAVLRQPVQPQRRFLYPMRLLVTGLGVGAIAGTILAVVDPTPKNTLRTNVGTVSPAPQQAAALPVAVVSQPEPAPQHPQQIELDALKTKVEAMVAAQKGLVPGLYFFNPETGATLDIAGETAVSAASTIKVPVLLAFFEAVDAGEASLDEALVMRADLMASEAGTMQYRPPGTEFSALETAEKMITISDNTATNMLIDRLGGADYLNRRFQAWGLTKTAIQNPLPDLEGTNTISPRDLSTLMLKVSRGELLSRESRDRVLKIMRRTVTKTLLPKGLGPDATIAHKTGDIGSIVGDTGLIEMANGQQYVATVMMERPHNDPRAQELIRKISRLTYEVFSKPEAAVPEQE